MLSDTCASAGTTLTRGLSIVHYLLSGSFKQTALYLLAFDPASRRLSLVRDIDAFGPHQYLALNADRSKVYATTWALPPALYAWDLQYPIEEPLAPPEVAFLGKAPITATSSYITVQDDLATSAGGPTGEVHRLQPDGSFGEKLQQVAFVDEAQLEREDKTRVALRYGSHAVEYTKQGKAFIPHLGHNSIWMYQKQPDGTLELLDEVKSPRDHDGPRHCIPSPSGQYLYSVTEHTQYVDSFEIQDKTLRYLNSQSLIPQGADAALYRGDTLRLSLAGDYLFATTRGGKSSTRGLLNVYPVRADGTLGEVVARWTTPTSGGKANAIELSPFRPADGVQWIVLTDDEVGLVVLLEWDAAQQTISEVDRLQLPGGAEASSSHAVWLS